MEPLNFREKVKKEDLWRCIYSNIMIDNEKYQIESIRYRYLIAKAKEVLKNVK